MMNGDRQSRKRNIFGALLEAAGVNTSSMRFRLYAFLFSTIVVLAIGILLILFFTGRFPVGSSEAERFTSREFDRLHGYMTEQCGDTTLQLISMSAALSRSIEFYLSEKQIPLSRLREHPEVLEDLISNELGRLQIALERTKSSGVFMVLDATVNQDLENSDNSKAGIHLRVSEPKVSGAATSTWNYFRGFPRIAYQNGINMMVRWDMEFDVFERDFYHLPIQQSMTTTLPLSKLYYWGMEGVIPDLDDAVLLCSIPLIDSGGNAFGVCGFEISQWNFSTICAPEDSEYPYTACLFGKTDGDSFITGSALISDKPAGIGGVRVRESFALPDVRSFDVYRQERGIAYYGMHDEIRLYPFDSPFAEQRFALKFLIPKDAVDEIMRQADIQTILIVAAFLALGILASVFVVNRYLNPIMTAIDAVRSGKLDGLKTNIVEIDHMIGQIQNHREKGRPLPDDFFSDFKKRVATLVSVEKKILDFYIDGKSDKEIISVLFITKGALRKHSERIYEKLGASGKEALMLYIELIKMSGQKDKII